MSNKLKSLIAVVTIAMLIYLVSSGGTLVAEDNENEAHDKFAGATVSVEASLVAVEFEVLEEIIDESDIETLSSIPLEKIMQCVCEDEGGEMISVVQLSVRNMSAGEMNKEENVEEERKVSDEQVSEHKKRKNLVSFQIVPEIIDTKRIAVRFDFKQIASEGIFMSESEAEEEEGRDIMIEISSEVVLRPGQPRIVSATKEDEAIFLIMNVDI
jgi:hypothetical protein